MKNDRIVAGISQGDINGIGYEIIIKTLLDPRILEMCTPVVYGSPKVSAYHRKALNIDNFSFNNIKDANEINHKRANIINCLDDNIRVELGKSTEIAGQASFISLEMAVNDLINKKIDILITAPINKNNIQSDKFQFAGHTEYLREKTSTNEVLMLLVNDSMKLGVVTGHIPLKNVASTLTVELILKKLRLLQRSLLEDFAIKSPKIAVLGLNPHNGDGGLIGSEETEIIIPAIDKARDEGIKAIGPFPADGFFGAGVFSQFDAVMAMYHDQGLAPFKALAFDSGVNYTAGLPVIRTSPDHGTAYEIAGKNVASPNSFRNALYLAIDIFKNRKLFLETTANPLPEIDIEKINS